MNFCTIGIDVGETESGSAFVTVGFEKEYAGVVVLDEKFIKGNVLTNPDDFYQQVYEYIIRQNYRGIKPRAIYFDAAQQMLKRGLETYLRSKGIYIAIYNSLKYPIIDRIMATNALFPTDRIKISNKCTVFIQGLEEAVWKSNVSPAERLDNFTSNIDILDAFEYAFEPYMYEIVTLLKKPQNYDNQTFKNERELRRLNEHIFG